MLKRRVFEDARAPAYWLVDPGRPWLDVLELVDGAYVERAPVDGTDAHDAALPYPVRVVPDDLVS